MINLLQKTTAASVLLMLCLFMSGVSDRTYARDHAVEIPENARATNYGKGWECKQGYRLNKGDCQAVNVPDNAYPTGSSYGRGWECKRNYRRVDEACVAIVVPPNAYLDHNGTAWRCNRGYRLHENACVAIEVPANGYLTEATYGPGWNASVAIVRQARNVWLSSYRKTRISTTPAVAGNVIHLTESDRTLAYRPRGHKRL